jgi:hypothetical protein
VEEMHHLIMVVGDQEKKEQEKEWRGFGEMIFKES